MEEEEEGDQEFRNYGVVKKESPIPVCRCLTSLPSSEKTPVNPRKQQIYSTVTRTEAYLRDRRIPELARFLITKIITAKPNDPVSYTQTLLDDCMLYRSGLGLPPVLYERQHLEAVVKSFDAGNRGWLSPGQIQRAAFTLGLPPLSVLESETPVDIVLEELERVQNKYLYQLLTAGTDIGGMSSSTSTEIPSSITQLQTMYVKEE